MAELDKRVGPFTVKQWAVGGVGGVLSYLGYRWWANRNAANAAAAQTATTGGTTIPPGGALGGYGGGLPRKRWLLALEAEPATSREGARTG